MHKLGSFARREDGAITVDWVVLCAALITTALFLMNLFGTQMIGVSSTLNTRVYTTVDLLSNPENAK